ncbi:MAG: cell division protein ZapA [Chitinivibrionales bacterium]
MGLSTESVRVYICGDEYSVKSDVDVETTKKIAEYVDQKMITFQKNIASRDKLKTAVLAALNIAGELFEYKSKYEEVHRRLDEIQHKTGSLSQKIDVSL